MGKITCAKCGLFCGFIQVEDGKSIPPALPESCPIINIEKIRAGITPGWEYASKDDLAKCPVASQIEALTPGSLSESNASCRSIPGHGARLTERQQAGKKNTYS